MAQDADAIALDDPLALTQALVRCPSVTPEDAGALGIMEGALNRLGFACHRLVFSSADTPDIDNLYAKLGEGHPHLGFAGHTDVVPVGDPESWSVDPFAAEVRDGVLIGRGAADMKGALACFVVALARFLEGRTFKGAISLLVTGDEEGPSINGTRKLLEWMGERGESLDACLVGEPTNPERLGEMIKIGRRGSLNVRLTVSGQQGHVGYPDLADNPIPRLMAMLTRIIETPLDEGTNHFQPSHVEVTSIDVGNEARGVIPAEARALFNIRYNNLHDARALEAWVRGRCDAVGGDYALEVRSTGEAFLTEPGAFSALIAGAVERATGIAPELATVGGTSDSRFIKDYCPVLDFGLVGRTMHKVDEQVPVEDLHRLSDIYAAILEDYFSA
jgi:succinyl-diaminopimelate desuccinylase